MDYNNLIFELINKCQEKLDKSKYEMYTTILDKLQVSLNNYNKLLEISDEEANLVNDEKIVIALKGMKILLSSGITIEENEIKNFISNFMDKVNKALESNEDIKIYKRDKKKYDDIKSVIENDFSEKEEIVLDFIKECFDNNMIDMETTVKLIFYVTSKKTDEMVSDVNHVNNVEEEVIVTENKEDISEELFRLFQQYNYGNVYSNLDKKIIKNMLKYVTIEHATVIMKFLNKHDISDEDFLNHQGIISRLMIFKDKTTLDTIDKFIENNDCTLPSLLSFGSIFFSETKKFKFRDKSDNIVIPSRNGFYAPSGQFDSFMYCIDLYKKAKNLPDDYKMTDSDFIKDNNVSMKTFFTTPMEKIKRNLFLLKKYGYVKDDELPNALVSLTGKNTEYLLDRLIEAGLYDYGKRFSSILVDSDFPFKWFKIKRANDFNMNLFDRGGIKSILKSDNKDFMGINWSSSGKSQIISQKPLNMEELVRGGRKLPISSQNSMLNNTRLSKEDREDLLPDEVARSEFKHFYDYSLFTPKDIFKAKHNYGSSSPENGLYISTIFNLDYKDIIEDITNAENDDYIKLLDQKYRLDDLTYCFNKTSTDEWPNVKILISRPKIIRLVSLLQKNNAWLNESMSLFDKENILLSIIVKDTVLSRNDLNVLRTMIYDIVMEYNRNTLRGRMIH